MRRVFHAPRFSCAKLTSAGRGRKLRFMFPTRAPFALIISTIALMVG